MFSFWTEPTCQIGCSAPSPAKWLSTAAATAASAATAATATATTTRITDTTFQLAV